MGVMVKNCSVVFSILVLSHVFPVLGSGSFLSRVSTRFAQQHKVGQIEPVARPNVSLIAPTLTMHLITNLGRKAMGKPTVRWAQLFYENLKQHGLSVKDYYMTKLMMEEALVWQKICKTTGINDQEWQKRKKEYTDLYKAMFKKLAGKKLFGHLEAERLFYLDAILVDHVAAKLNFKKSDYKHITIIDTGIKGESCVLGNTIQLGGFLWCQGGLWERAYVAGHELTHAYYKDYLTAVGTRRLLQNYPNLKDELERVHEKRADTVPSLTSYLMSVGYQDALMRALSMRMRRALLFIRRIKFAEVAEQIKYAYVDHDHPSDWNRLKHADWLRRLMLEELMDTESQK